MDVLLKQRLVGAVVLVALGVIFIPMLLENPERNQVPEMESLPELFESAPQAPLQTFPAPDQVPEEPELSVLAEDVQPTPEPESAAVPEVGAVEPEPVPAAVEAPPTAEAPAPLGNWVVQAGSFTDQDKAVALRGRLRDAGFVTQVEKVRVEGRNYYRVRVGPYLERSEADRDQQQLNDKFKLGARVLSYP